VDVGEHKKTHRCSASFGAGKSPGVKRKLHKKGRVGERENRPPQWGHRERQRGEKEQGGITTKVWERDEKRQSRRFRGLKKR